MPGRNRRLRLFTFGAVLFFVLLVFTRNSSRRREKYQDYFGDKLAIAGIGGGSVLRPTLKDIPPQQERYPVPHDDPPPEEPEVVTVWVDAPEDQEQQQDGGGGGDGGDGDGGNGGNGGGEGENRKFWDDVDGRDLGRQDDWGDFESAKKQQAPLDSSPVPVRTSDEDLPDSGSRESQSQSQSDRGTKDGQSEGNKNSDISDADTQTPIAVSGDGQGKGRHDPDGDSSDRDDSLNFETSAYPTSTKPAVHWTKTTEFYPIKTTIPLPSGSSRPFAKIQREEKKLAQNGVDLEKRAAIKAVAEHTWKGYVSKAFGADEVRPLSGTQHNPFNGWGATLVDGLDTLWIMGMKDEFEKAVQKVDEIDFTTSKRSDIPVFETVIRYLGGLIGAFDVSGRDPKYRVLLDKAVELAEVIYGAFDTPNRMPQMYYRWDPASANEPHRAGSRTVMSEIGSLSMEFTRLAQITQENKYYDAIARITDEFESFQNFTRLPGMWPTNVDASGCDSSRRTTMSYDDANIMDVPGGTGEQMEAAKPVSRHRGPPESRGSNGDGYADGADTEPTTARAKKENLDDLMAKGDESGLKKIAGLGKPAAMLNNELGAAKRKRSSTIEARAEGAAGPVDGCWPKGLSSSSSGGSEKFTLSGMSDSTYEYLPKEYLLLGGLAEQYKTMYLASADAVIQNLIYRPMTPDSRDILASGELQLRHNSSFTEDSDDDEATRYIGTFKPEIAHLTCFAGGMFAMGGVIFNKPEHVEIGAKLTDGCVWAYNSTASGIMPEGGELMQCPETWGECPWNQTAYWNELDPFHEQRQQAAAQEAEELIGQAVNKIAEAVTNKKSDDDDEEEYATSSSSSTTSHDLRSADTTTTTTTHDDLETDDDKPLMPTYQISAEELEAEAEAAAEEGSAGAASNPNLRKRDSESDPDTLTKRAPPPRSYNDPASEAQADYIAHKMSNDGLPPGFIKISGRKYILRPEAIESVFYMYRISGDPYWREVGWDMWRAVDKHTRAEFGASALDDITSAEPGQDDSEESFWIAETLKYFYLLFDDPDSWSLDEWVLNTEAHFFRRPAFKAVH